VFAPLHLRSLSCFFPAEVDTPGVLQLAAAIAVHEPLNALTLTNLIFGSQVAVDSIVDAAMTCGLRSLALDFCGFDASPLPALARLLRGGPELRELSFCCDAITGFNGGVQGSILFSDALRANRSLESLSLVDPGERMWRTEYLTPLLQAVASHPTLRCLDLQRTHSDAPPEAPAAVGAALGALVAADAPALEVLKLAICNLGDEGLAPMLDALPRNAHLRLLDVALNDASEEFAQERLRPAALQHPCLKAFPQR
jgi:hypothetical protein